MRRAVRQRLTILGLTAPAYVWLALTIFLPLSAMFYFSFLTVVPLAARGTASFTLGSTARSSPRSSIGSTPGALCMLGLHVTLGCLVVGYPGGAHPGQACTRPLARGAVPAHRAALLEQWPGAHLLLDHGAAHATAWPDRVLHALLPGAPSLDLLFTYPAIIIGLVHAYVPYMILTCYISLQAIDDSLVEAARSLGASPARRSSGASSCRSACPASSPASS